LKNARTDSKAVRENDSLVGTLRENFDVIASLERRQSDLLKDHSE
jgi:hypothetical protein